mmetsp:Transcript_20940/g.49957  ORF Transcript_20940/g.49957 Transcript_20940/m.49957 type:complete len:318 (+) Transcript_20940:522-1475(+)
MMNPSFFPWNALAPVYSSHISTPNAHTSALNVTRSSRSHSGDMWDRVPNLPGSMLSPSQMRARPKSQTFAEKPRLSASDLASMTFRPLRSQCTMFASWRCAIPLATSLSVVQMACMSGAASGSLAVLSHPREAASIRVPRSQNSCRSHMTCSFISRVSRPFLRRCDCSPVRTHLMVFTTHGCAADMPRAASFSAAVTDSSVERLSTLTATLPPSHVPRYTLPKAPLPMRGPIERPISSSGRWKSPYVSGEPLSLHTESYALPEDAVPLLDGAAPPDSLPLHAAIRDDAELPALPLALACTALPPRDAEGGARVTMAK